MELHNTKTTKWQQWLAKGIREFIEVPGPYILVILTIFYLILLFGFMLRGN